VGDGQTWAEVVSVVAQQGSFAVAFFLAASEAVTRLTPGCCTQNWKWGGPTSYPTEKEIVDTHHESP
jgi:hypothetical protein